MDGKSWPPIFAKSMVTGSSQFTRAMPNKPFSVMYAEMPRNTSTTSDFKLPPPMRTKVRLPQPEASVMPMPNIIPPTICASQMKRGRG